MADTEIGILIRAKDEATRQLEGINGKIQGMSKQLRIAGGIMMGVGAGITAVLGSAMKAAAEEEAGIIKMSTAMHNMGIEYDQVKDSLEGWIDAQQQKTAIADSDQREALATLITMTGDLTQAQDLLTVAMDLSAGTGKDLGSSTTILGYALAGNWGMLNRMLPAMASLKTEEEKWAFLREKFAGQAEAYGQTMAGQMQLLKNNIGDIKETVGGFIVEAVAPLVQNVQAVIQNIKGWAAEHPELMRTIVLVTGVVGLLLIPLGGLLMILPSLAAGIKLVSGALALLNFNPVVLGITLLVVAVAGLALAWKNNWGNIRGITENVVNAIVHAFAWLWDKILIGVEWAFKAITWQIRAFALLLSKVPIDAVSNFGDKILDGLKAADDAIENFRQNSVANMQNFQADFGSASSEAKDESDKMTTGVDSASMSIGDLQSAGKELLPQFEQQATTTFNNVASSAANAARAIQGVKGAMGGGGGGGMMSNAYWEKYAEEQYSPEQVAAYKAAFGEDWAHNITIWDPSTGITAEQAKKTLDYFASVGGSAPSGYHWNVRTGELESYQYGGIVPGPIGRPVPVIAHGGEMYLGSGGSRSPIQNVIHVYLDGREVRGRIVDRITQDVKLQGGS